MRGTTLRGFSPRKETWKRKSRTKEDLAGDGKGLYLVPFMRWEVFGGSESGSLWRMDCGGGRQGLKQRITGVPLPLFTSTDYLGLPGEHSLLKRSVLEDQLSSVVRG